jgi:hypothetical protein
LPQLVRPTVFHDVRQTVPLQGFEKTLDGILEDTHHTASGRQSAFAAPHEINLAFRMANQVADIDLACVSREPKAATAAPKALYIAGPGQVTRYFHQVVLRDAMGSGDLANRAKPILVRRQIQHYPDRKVSVSRQPHRSLHICIPLACFLFAV